ncbi:EAL domain-containing protein [Marilutibacter spongiae]|uniref:cyclic-guanylate-specific phosphodiesterase n=1 Tax=Marilutibacter spongiae TaxID=2025720 RepID=A0A7W3TKW6_9GAMM|nr:EAL domain-containing protein [Lysobacter spongiae]MBB1060218.1 EAL domain-containing protein [Lysobacter spongiae]
MTRAMQGWCLVLFAMLGIGAASAVHANVRDFYFIALGSDRGLAQNTVRSLVEDPQGFVWVGTYGGLHRYDGRRFQLFQHDPRDPASLPDSYITALAVSDERNLWIGTYSEYVARLDLTTGEIQRFGGPGDDEARARRQVRALLPRSGQLWIATGTGLERLEPASGERTRVLAFDSGALSASAPQSLVADRRGNVWYGNAMGLFRIAPDGDVGRVGPAEAVSSLAIDGRGRLLVGRVDGLLVVDDAGRLHPLWPREAMPGASTQVMSIVEAPDQRLWLAVANAGLVRLDRGTGQWEQIREDPLVPASLPESNINTLLVDRGGMLWAGGSFRGVSVTDPQGTRLRYIFDRSGGDEHRLVAHNSVRAIHERDDGELWLATDDNGFYRYEVATDRFEHWKDALQEAFPGLATSPRVLSISDAGHGRLWLATSQGLVRFDPAEGRFETGMLGAYAGTQLRSALVDHQGDLWLGTQNIGVLHMRRDGGHVVNYDRGDGDDRQFSHGSVHALLEDRKERIWIGTGDGLSVLDPRTGQLRHFRHGLNDPASLSGNLVRALHMDAQGSIWVGTRAGLSRVQEDGDGTVRFEHPLAASLADRPVPMVFSIGESRSGELWLGTDGGLLRFNPRTGMTHAYGLADGAQDLEFNGGAYTRLRDGRLAFGGVRGLNLFMPEALKPSDFNAPLRLLSARIGTESPSDGATMWQPQAIDVSGDTDLLRLRIGALDYSPAFNVRYRYMMEGFDRDWVDNGGQANITYTRLPPGSYTFRAQATNRDGAWGPTELRLPVTVSPPLWRHPLTLTLLIIAALMGAAVAGWRWRQSRRREQGWFEQIREREERLKLALWASGEQFWDYDLGNRQLHWMRVYDQDGNAPQISTQTQVNATHEIHDDDLERVATQLRRHLRGDTALFLSEHRSRRPDGSWAWMRTRGRVVERDAQGRAVRVAGTARDITNNRSAERERRIASEVLRSMAEAVAVFDREFHFVSVNPAFERMTGYPGAEVIGRPTSLLDSQQHDPAFYQHMRNELERNGRWSGEIWQQRKDGNEFLCALQSTVVHEAGGQAGNYVAVLGDITDQKRAEQELRYLANYDTLTSLPNRALLSERLSRAIVRARRNGRKIAVLFLDLDRFKDINDSLGHAAGDRILRAAANRLQQTVGPGHTVARLGGDEFTVVLEDIDSVEDAERIARELLDAFESALDFDERHDVSISPSIGIALYPDHAQVPTDLLKHADTAMYQAKAAGRRTFMRYHEAMDVEIRRRATITAALRKVLDRGELQLVFQPQLSLAEQAITGVEALLRWNSEEHGPISPAQFIPLAEETGLILEIGEWVLHEASSRLMQWRAEGITGLTMAVNVSALQLLRGDLPHVVERVLRETGIPPRRLELELTESVIMANAEQTANTLRALRDLGVGLAVDDFGTGYSSLAYLKRLPLTSLKIDKEFIDDLSDDSDDAAITSTIITMAHSLGLNVVAEGVEETAQMEFLRDQGCDEIQGYWLARPLDAEACARFLREWGDTSGTGRRQGAGAGG